MKKRQAELSLEKISSIPDIDLKNSDTTLMQIKVTYRRKYVNQLRLRGYTNKEIADKIGCGLSTVEKDLRAIRETSRQWFEEDSITEYCESLQNSVILFDCGIEELRLLYEEEDDSEIKIRIWSKITEFQKERMELLEKTEAVQKYLKSKQCRKQNSDEYLIKEETIA